MMLAQDDLCAGWAHDATMMVTIRSTGEIPVSTGPTAPQLELDDDPLAWHEMDRLASHAMRRRRRIDVVGSGRAVAAPGEARPSGEPDASHRIDAHFRDSHMGEWGTESVVHEYSVSGGIDIGEGRVLGVTARAHVLPWMECPGAVASADRLAGMRIEDLRDRVRREFTGASTCTHLNDTLRSLADVGVLVGQLSD
jgi:hypothetical protein